MKHLLGSRNRTAAAGDTEMNQVWFLPPQGLTMMQERSSHFSRICCANETIIKELYSVLMATVCFRAEKPERVQRRERTQNRLCEEKAMTTQLLSSSIRKVLEKGTECKKTGLNDSRRDSSQESLDNQVNRILELVTEGVPSVAFPGNKTI